jgi:hypothetical protein
MSEPKEQTVSERVRPAPHPFYGDSYERGLDPWHRDAFAGIPGAQEAIDEGRVIDIGVNAAEHKGERKGGWFLLDGFGNAIGFVPDGASPQWWRTVNY